MSDELCYIPDDDGYTDKAYIGRIPNLHPAVRITFRPVRPDVRFFINDQLKGKSTVEGEKMIAQQVADNIVDWNIKQANGEKAPINAKFVFSLKAPLFRRLSSIVYFGIDGGDPDPESSSDERQEKLKAQVKAISDGTTTLDNQRGN